MRPGHWCSEPDPDGLLRPGAGAGLHPAYTGSSPRRWTNSASATGTGISGFEDLSFILGQPAPYSSVLVGLHGPLQTGFNDVAATADSFCLFDLEARGVAPPVREEQIRVLAQAGGAVAPGHQLGLLRVRGSTQGMLQPRLQFPADMSSNQRGAREQTLAISSLAATQPKHSST